jgi:hypothetical protein
MVQLQRYLQKTNDFQDSKNLPLLNSLFVERFSQFNPYSQDNDFKSFMRWARRSPQLMGFLGIIATDMLSDKIDFSPLDKSSGRNRVLKAKAFWDLNKGADVAEETIYDLLIDGIGYNWVGKIDDIQLKEFCQLAVREVMPETKAKELEFKANQMVQLLKKDNSEKLVKN